jgi:hypothetical protein
MSVGPNTPAPWTLRLGSRAFALLRRMEAERQEGETWRRQRVGRWTDALDVLRRFLRHPGNLPVLREALAAADAAAAPARATDHHVVERLAWELAAGRLVLLERHVPLPTGPAVKPPHRRKGAPVPPPVPPPAPVSRRFGVTALSLPPRFAPQAEKVDVSYRIQDPDGAITSATLLLYRTGLTAPVWSRVLSAAERTDGEHTIEWDGTISAHADFPERCVTIEHSPYRLRIEVAGGGTADPAFQEATFAVEISRIEVALAPRTCLVGSAGQDDDRAVYDQVGTLPASGLVTLRLGSDLYITGLGEMTDATGFTAYRTLWGDGPRIPLVATAYVKHSSGGEVAVGTALGRARILWDHAEATGTTQSYNHPSAKTFIDNAAAYDAANGRPANGVDTHVDRGGKRAAATGSPAVFSAADAKVTNFPYAVAAGATRWWAAFSPFQKGGDFDARAGAVFRPSRTAGDTYHVKAYLARGGEMDTADAAPAGALAEAEVGRFEIWREITLAQHYRKCPQITASVPSIAGYYGEAFVKVDNRLGSGHTMTKAEYDAAYTAALASVPAATVHYFLRQYSLPAGESQYDLPRPANSLGGRILQAVASVGTWFGVERAATTWVATFLPYDDFKQAVKTGEGYNDATLAARLTAANLGTEQDYAEGTKGYAKAIARAMCKALSTVRGVTVLQFERTHSLEELLSGRLNGHAVVNARDKTGFAIYNPRQDTTGHEIGHCLFLPHAPRLSGSGAVINSGGGITPDRHDGNEMNCLMSYARPREGFCGLCLLRLRGWDQSQFNRNGPTVVK